MRHTVSNPAARTALARMARRILTGDADAFTAAADCGAELRALGERWATVSEAGPLAHRAHGIVWRRSRRFLASLA